MLRYAEPRRSASAIDALFGSWMLWMTSLQPSASKAQSMAAVAASSAYPLPVNRRRRLQPTSVPGQPSGIHGPACPIHSPLAFSTSENIANPCIAHAPGICRNLRHAAVRVMWPPIQRAVSSSAIISA